MRRELVSSHRKMERQRRFGFRFTKATPNRMASGSLDRVNSCRSVERGGPVGPITSFRCKTWSRATSKA